LEERDEKKKKILGGNGERLGKVGPMGGVDSRVTYGARFGSRPKIC